MKAQPFYIVTLWRERVAHIKYAAALRWIVCVCLTSEEATHRQRALTQEAIDLICKLKSLKPTWQEVAKKIGIRDSTKKYQEACDRRRELFLACGAKLTDYRWGREELLMPIVLNNAQWHYDVVNASDDPSERVADHPTTLRPTE